MSKNLFEIPVCESPRLKWLKKHNVKTWRTESDETSNKPWLAWAQDEDGDVPHDGNASFGATEHDALVNLAMMLGWRLWNEE